uniref:Pentatricopeptide repeat-containing protein n=1 Tax=Rhizophora mucronata TaxID=61149 RepID=A0A2P2NJW2_RHIMU
MPGIITLQTPTNHDVPRNYVPLKHCVKQFISKTQLANTRISRQNRIARYQISMRSFIEHLPTNIHNPTTAVHVNQRVPHWQHAINTVLHSLPMALLPRY